MLFKKYISSRMFLLNVVTGLNIIIYAVKFSTIIEYHIPGIGYLLLLINFLLVIAPITRLKVQTVVPTFLVLFVTLHLITAPAFATQKILEPAENYTVVIMDPLYARITAINQNSITVIRPVIKNGVIIPTTKVEKNTVFSYFVSGSYRVLKFENHVFVFTYPNGTCYLNNYAISYTLSP
jgi:hypothetical protein